MKTKQKTMILIGIIMAFLSVAVFAGCSKEKQAQQGVNDVIWLEWWDELGTSSTIEKDYPQNEEFINAVGVGITSPMVPWNGGVDYLQRLQLAIAAGKIPDVFLPMQNIEVDLAKQGALADLTELLPIHAPNIWNNIPQEIWDVVRSNSPDGKSIYFIPEVYLAPYAQGFVRQDWLDKLGLKMPTTIEEYENVLRAFRDRDPNGNGLQDELPTSGREFIRWMDHLFAPFGIALFEGYPEWHIYDGKLQYSAVQPGMKAALEWIAKLYKEKLLDQESMLNSGTVWNSKIDRNLIGSWFHAPRDVDQRLVNITSLAPDAWVEVMPPLKAPGYTGAYFNKEYRGVVRAIKNMDQQRVIAALKLLNYIESSEHIDRYIKGYEGIDLARKDGQLVRVVRPESVRKPLEPKILTSKEYFIYLREAQKEETPTLAHFYDNDVKLIRDSAATPIAGAALPASIYDGLPDIKSHKLYQEYASKIIIGEWPISKFDEFVDLWYKQGGQTVTERAQAAYVKMSRR